MHPGTAERPDGNSVPLIVHVFPTFAVGGGQARFVAIANHFGPSFRHKIVSLDGELACREWLRPDLRADFPVVGAPKNAMLANAWRFRALLRAWRPDLLVTCNWGAIEFALANILPITRQIHIVDGFGPEERTIQLPRRVMVRRLALSGSTVVVPSRSLVRTAMETWKLPAATIRYIPNGIDLSRFASDGSLRGAAEPVIGTVAALREEKNVARLLRAVALLPRGQLVIVGDGPERPALEALAVSLGIAGRVRFVGHCHDPAPLYAGFDIFALSSDTEQMPLSVIEAMASGLPVVSTDVGDVRLMLSDENAFAVTELDDVSLADALGALIGDAARRQGIGLANLAKAQREFGQAAMFAAYGALWRGAESGP